MRLKIRHVTRYRFETPVRGAVQSLRLWPASCEGQRVLRWDVEAPGGIWGADFTDGAGDRLRTLALRGPLSEIELRIDGEVETTDLAGVLRGHREAVPPQAYARVTRRTMPDVALAELAASALSDLEGAPALQRAHALAAAVSDAIAYRPGETEAHTTAAEALNLGVGVCQDHAHALIALAYQAAMPARYVTGYLHASCDDTPHEAAHAWAELHVEGLGWVGFDASNRCCPDDRYVRVGSGLDAQDAAPIRGILRGGAGEVMDVTVAVEAAQQ